MKLTEYHYNQSTKELFLNILPFAHKSLFYIYCSQVDSSYHPKFYFRNVMEINGSCLFWIEFIVGKLILSINFIDYERKYLEKWNWENYE